MLNSGAGARAAHQSSDTDSGLRGEERPIARAPSVDRAVLDARPGRAAGGCRAGRCGSAASSAREPSASARALTAGPEVDRERADDRGRQHGQHERHAPAHMPERRAGRDGRRSPPRSRSRRDDRPAAPASTDWPSRTCSSATTAVAGARSSFSIFIASMTTSGCRPRTSVSGLDEHPHDLARHRRGQALRPPIRLRPPSLLPAACAAGR